jgi:hypothetical protein
VRVSVDDGVTRAFDDGLGDLKHAARFELGQLEGRCGLRCLSSGERFRWFCG